MDFFVLPDTPGATAVFGELARTPDRTGRTPFPNALPHGSGRPWIVGDWAGETVVEAVAGNDRVALFGPASVSAGQLREAVGRARSVRDLDALCARVSGSFHLVASIAGEVRVQGTVSAARRVFHTRRAGVTVAATAPTPLVGDLDDTDLDEELLACRLLAPWPPWPFSERPLWRGVETVPVGCFLELDRSGRGRHVRWWRPPKPHLPLEEGAARVREALREAVAVRARGAATISADLSGGMDSTSLCFLAADAVDRLVTTRWEAVNPTDEDQVWAGLAADHLPDARHLVLPRETAPSWFADLAEPDPDIEGPFAWIRTRSRLTHMARQVAAAGSADHLTGHGGDELFMSSPLDLHTLARTRRAGAIRHLRAHRAMYRWRLVPTVRGLLENGSFGSWLVSSAGTLTDPVRETGGSPSFSWGIGYRLPPWATPDAVAAVRRLLRRTGAAGPEPLAPQRGRHATLQDVRLCGDTLRRVDRLTSRSGVRWHAPFVDDRVVEAALAIRIEDTTMPDRYKPALTTAMRGVLPDAVRGRATKAEYSAEAYDSLRRRRAELLELCGADMRLARLGLVDAARVRSVLEALPPSSLALTPLISTFACETWLRSVEAARSVAAGGPL
ncbi:hypothetical protein GCM10009678_82320 [Actinomadura kijaniata]|uniref:asparagine synthase (glutamine-hydrolyzing) n=1 Tax=Actinomadura namibiensis TaxID=182080 RepID=A0A7W3QQW4_ACTNM|nr:asparagine synthase-related protein [Actinomadura namibiensis]MBA8956007.1 asparagine synthase (glutamine-hydrolyzing) [Actinomadura namibiensis]